MMLGDKKNSIKVNYQNEMEKEIKSFNGKKPKILIHSCCAPCSSYVLEYLSNYFEITVYFYNPNINIESEYEYRKEEQKRLIEELNIGRMIKFLEGEFKIMDFFNKIKGLENIFEGGERCFKCYELRLEKSAEMAKNNNFDYFTTTLSISPLKNSHKLNEIGLKLEEKYGIKWLKSDFKKKNGYKRSIELSIEHGLYRQDYCGCSFSKRESKMRGNSKN